MDMTTRLIELETAEYRILGTITLPVVKRLSDALNDRERDFLPLADVTRWTKLDGMQTRHSFMAVARGHVICGTEPEPHDLQALRTNRAAEQ
ncbi:MAG: hypothetical protein NVSMB51_21260 [Solirubrobacteraceae bacterium]